MQRRLLALCRSSVFFAFVASVLLFPGDSPAVVSDARLTGLPPNTVVTLTNDKTGEKVEGKTDDRGIATFLLGDRNWEAGSYRVTFWGVSRAITLKDDPNQIDLSGLLPSIRGLLPGRSHSIDIQPGVKFFEFALKPIDSSFGLRIDYSPPLLCCEDTFSLVPYVSLWTVPGVNIGKHPPFNFAGTFKSIDDGWMLGLTIGLMHASDLAKWGIAPESAAILGILMMGIGWAHYDFDLKRVAGFPHNFTIADRFNSRDDALRLEFNVGVEANWPGGYFLGIRGGAAPTYTDIFNGGRRWRTEGSVGLVGGLRW